MNKHFIFQNRIVFTLMCCWFLLITVVSTIACYFGYEQRKGEMISELNMTLARTVVEFQKITNDFWDVYMPVYQDKEIYEVLNHFFSTDNELEPYERVNLVQELKKIAERNDYIVWIAVIYEERDDNYIFFPAESSLQQLTDDFPYMDKLRSKSSSLELYGENTIVTQNGVEYDCIALAGGTPNHISNGSIVVGFSTGGLAQKSTTSGELNTFQIDIAAKDESIYTTGENAFIPNQLPQKGLEGICEGRYVYVSNENTRQGTTAYYSVDWTEIFLRSQKGNLIIILLVVMAIAATLVLYVITVRMLYGDILVIKTGLEEIGQNKLDTRIHGDFKQNGLQEVVDSINDMAGSLQENVERAYYYEIKQKEAEMQELQAKFNPHFLYNSLEVFCARCYQNGDDETAELISQTATLFRGLIDSRTFISLHEELAYSKKYSTLFSARYDGKVQILYDFDSNVLEYGIIRNTFQPLIENYFEHGIDTNRDDNYIRFCGRLSGDEDILIIVEDNGRGMTEAACKKLNAGLQEPINTSKESYGAKNLHQRIRLFYGDEYGLSFHAKENGGLLIKIKIKQKYCSESEQ